MVVTSTCAVLTSLVMLMPLATTADLEARIGALTATQTARADALLADAEALIVDYADQFTEFIADDVLTLRAAGSRIRLPAGPVTAVSSVVAVGCAGADDTALGVGGWCWDGIDTITLDPPAVVGSFRVTYSHGYAVVPPIIVATISAMVNRVLTAPTLAEGLTQENIGQYGYQVQQSSGSQGSAVRLLAADRRALRRWHTSSTTIRTPSD